MSHQKGDKYKCKSCSYTWKSRKSNSSPAQCPKCGNRSKINTSENSRKKQKRRNHLNELKKDHVSLRIGNSDFREEVKTYMRRRSGFRWGIVTALLSLLVILGGEVNILIKLSSILCAGAYVYIHHKYLKNNLPPSVEELPPHVRTSLSKRDLPEKVGSTS